MEPSRNFDPKHLFLLRHGGLIGGAAMLSLFAVLIACKTADTGGDSTDMPDEPVAMKGDYEVRWEERPFEEVATSCYNCHETLSRQYGRPAREHITSAHYRATVTCHECHGGDPTQDDIDLAHNLEMGFVATLEAEEMNTNCGSCHAKEVEFFVASKHYPDHEGVRKVTCVECHGSHDIGARREDFLWTKNCAQCHDLEQVPDLPASLVAMTDSKDALHTALRQLRFKLNNQPFPPEVMEPYREVRQLSADVVHKTHAEGIDAQMNEIVEKNKALEAKIMGLVNQGS